MEAKCVLIEPLAMDASRAAILAAVRPFPGLPLPNQKNVDVLEKRVLRRTLKWRDPRGLMAYSHSSLYKDLYVYFDAAATEEDAVPNALATNSFKMYGLDGKQHVMDWDVVRGPVVVVRAEPSNLCPPGTPFVPTLTADEMADTFEFFRDSPQSAKQIATKRDARRFTQSYDPSIFALGDVDVSSSPFFVKSDDRAPRKKPDFYVGPAGARDFSKVVAKDARVCGACGKPHVLGVRKFLVCSQCRQVYYCDKDCQRRHWRQGGHKFACVPAAVPAGAGAAKPRA